MVNEVVKARNQSAQIVAEDSLDSNGLIAPFVDFGALRRFFYANTYHRKAIKIKSWLLSQIDETDLDKRMPADISPRNFLFGWLINLELYGNAFIERSGSADYLCYLLPSYEARLDNQRQIYQVKNNEKKRLEGWRYGYYSPMSRFYGEPDYLSALSSIINNEQIDSYNSAFFANGAKPDTAVIFEGMDATEEQMSVLRDYFGTQFKGVSNAHKTLVLSTGTAVLEGSTKPSVRFEDLNKINDMSFEQLRNINRDEIVAAHGVPPRLVGVMSAGQLGGGGEVIGQLHVFNELEIKPKIEGIERFFDSIGIKLRLKPIDVTNFKDDAEVVGGLVAQQILSVSEARDILGWNKRIQE